MGSVYRQGRMIFLSGEITNESAGELINNLMTLIQYDDQEDNRQKNYQRDEIKLFIKSNGGNLTDMFGIIDFIESSKTVINTYAIGNIASAAVPLFLSGKKKYVYKNTQIMIHSCAGSMRGTVQELTEYTPMLEDLQEMIDKYILSKSKISQNKLTEIKEKKLNWYLYSEEALKLGIVDEIL